MRKPDCGRCAEHSVLSKEIQRGNYIFIWSMGSSSSSFHYNRSSLALQKKGTKSSSGAGFKHDRRHYFIHFIMLSRFDPSSENTEKKRVSSQISRKDPLGRLAANSKKVVQWFHEMTGLLNLIVQNIIYDLWLLQIAKTKYVLTFNFVLYCGRYIRLRLILCEET